MSRHLRARITAAEFTCRSEGDSTIDLQLSEAESWGLQECRSHTSFVSLSFGHREDRTVFEVHEIGNPCGPSSDFEAVWEQLGDFLVQEYGGSSVSLESPR